MANTQSFLHPLNALTKRYQLISIRTTHPLEARFQIVRFLAVKYFPRPKIAKGVRLNRDFAQSAIIRFGEILPR